MLVEYLALMQLNHCHCLPNEVYFEDMFPVFIGAMLRKDVEDAEKVNHSTQTPH